MNKSLQIVLGLVLILVLACIAFLDVSTKIKDDLLTKTKVMFSENNVRDVTANIQGEGSNMSRNLVLTGTAISELERVRIVTLTKNIEGVCRIDNKIKLHPLVPKSPLVVKVPTAIKVPVVEKPTKVIITKSTLEVVIEKRESNASTKRGINIPPVPVPVNNGIIVPIPVEAISAPRVIKIEKIKLEGVE